MLLGLAACKQKDLYDMTPQGDVPVDVVIHWDNAQTDGFVKPTNMTVHWYPSSGSLISNDMAPDGARAWLYADEYDAMCMDFNSSTTMSFRTKGDRSSFEVYNNLKTGTYNALVPQLPDGEVTVAEAYPYNFYIC